MSIITLTTDFGGNDPFFGIMKGVILSIYPEARIEDITHDISPQDIWQANFVLQASYHYFPKSTIHVCVVDPGVGSQRRPILIETKKYFFTGPDNGIFTGILEKENIVNVVELTEKKYWLPKVSQTFHGRDIFAPVAGHLAKQEIGETAKGRRGDIVKKFGREIDKDNLTRLPIPEPIKNKKSYLGIVQYIDHFGNLITNIPNNNVPGKISGKVKDINFNGLVSSFSNAQGGKLTAIKGSSGFLELFVYKQNAAKVAKIVVGEPIEVLFS